MHRWTTHGKKRRSALPAEVGVATVKGRHGRLHSRSEAGRHRKISVDED